MVTNPRGRGKDFQEPCGTCQWPSIVSQNGAGNWVECDIGDASEPKGLGTGAAVADIDGDGRLELLM